MLFDEVTDHDATAFGFWEYGRSFTFPPHPGLPLVSVENGLTVKNYNKLFYVIVVFNPHSRRFVTVGGKRAVRGTKIIENF